MPFNSHVSGDWIEGTDRFLIDEPLGYYSPRHKTTYEAPIWFNTDFSSIPVVCWSILGLNPTSREVRRAGVIHDYLYRFGYKIEVTRAQADQLFYDMIREEGLGYIKGQLCWQALRMFGSANYKGEYDGS